MTYAQLPIHMRINAKNNAKVLWHDSPRKVYRRRFDGAWDCNMYSPERLRLTGFNFREPKNAGNPKY